MLTRKIETRRRRPTSNDHHHKPYVASQLYTISTIAQWVSECVCDCACVVPISVYEIDFAVFYQVLRKIGRKMTIVPIDNRFHVRNGPTPTPHSRLGWIISFKFTISNRCNSENQFRNKFEHINTAYTLHTNQKIFDVKKWQISNYYSRRQSSLCECEFLLFFVFLF